MKAHRNVICCAIIALLACPVAAQHAHEQVVDNPFDHESESASDVAPSDLEHAHVTHEGAANDPFGTDPILVRVYDISDLIVTPGTYPAKQESQLIRESNPIFPPMQSPSVSGPQTFGGGFGGMGGGMGMGGMGGGSGTQGGGFFQVPDGVSVSQPGYLGQAMTTSPSASGWTSAPNWCAAIDELIESITSVIEPQSWSEVGGEGNIAVVGQTLVIGQTASVHDRVAIFLQELRQSRADRKTLIVQVDWLWLTPQQHARWLHQSSSTKPYGSISVDEWQAWRTLPAVDGLHHYAASVRCFSGQTVHVQAGVQQLHVTGMTAVVGSEPGYQPQISLAQEGAVVQVTPVLQSDDDPVVIDLHSRVTVRKPSEATAPQAGAGVTMGNLPLQTATAVDRPALQVQRLSTTTRLPLNQVTLIGGMTFSPEHEASHLYVFVLVTRPE